ncbi:hypothetical protein [Longimicrobium sp.]|uniref:hypothetical protein n=1 Tax=Longimicrobium sp. TaxID=2029185 RepID=UPI003B3ACA73
MLSSRNEQGLSQAQIQTCIEAWIALGGNAACALDTSVAEQSGSRTAFYEERNAVALGADVYPSHRVTFGNSARSRMSVLACLAHELAHAHRFNRGYIRPFDRMSYLIEEAQASLDASFELILDSQDRLDLVEDAHDQTAAWLKLFTEDVER